MTALRVVLAGAFVVGSTLAGVCAAADAPDDALAAAFDAYDAKDYARALALLEPLAEAGDPLAQTNLAYMLYEGLGTRADDAAAAQWYRRAAEAGEPNAQYDLGVMYENGRGVVRDYAEAANWWRRAAKQGYAPAQYNLGALYYNGRGVPKDLLRAWMWKSLAVDGELPTVTARKARVSRDAVAAALSPSALAQAKAMRDACVETNFDECD